MPSKAKASPKPIVKRPHTLAGGVSKTKNVVFAHEVQDYVLDMQKSQDFQTPNHGDLVETRAHNYQVKLEAKKFDVEQLEAVISTCSKERDELSSHPAGGCCFGRQGQTAERRRVIAAQAENELGKERDQLADLEGRFKAQVNLLVARVAAALAADIDEEEFYESPRTSDTAGAGPHVSTPLELEDIWEGDGDDAAQDAEIRTPSVPLDLTEEGLRAQDIILHRLTSAHPPPPTARVSSSSASGSLSGHAQQHQQGPRISHGGGSAPLVKRLSGAGKQQPQPFEARDGERWPAERPWEHEQGDPERRNSGRKRTSGAQKLYSLASVSNSMRSANGSDTDPGVPGPPSPSPSSLTAHSGLSPSGVGSENSRGSSLDLPPLLQGRVPGPPLKRLSLKDAVKALEVARDKANALDSTPSIGEKAEEGSDSAAFMPLLEPKALERHPSKLKFKMPLEEDGDDLGGLAAQAGHQPPMRTARLSFTMHNPFGGPGGVSAGPKPPGKGRSFQFGQASKSSAESGTGLGGTAVPASPKAPAKMSSLGMMNAKLRTGATDSAIGDGDGGDKEPVRRTVSGPRKWLGNMGNNASIPEDSSMVGVKQTGS